MISRHPLCDHSSCFGFQSSDEDELMTGVVADEPNKFDVLCDGVINTIALLHESLRDLLDVKDTLLQHFLPPPVLLKLSLTCSKVFRR